eukprot:TRINITY_DN1932_c0_g1_i1.p1 TRINITY_DN1932_c0_g1~~TRINITY_DN1932_c0_g1_i1.p1  ORF type:complete len:139 (+),score=12.41 TRINITY_DN1932_c0_g1_i1:283-699(+)
MFQVFPFLLGMGGEFVQPRPITNAPSVLVRSAPSPERLEVPKALKTSVLPDDSAKPAAGSAGESQLSVEEHNALVFQELKKALKCPVCLDSVSDMTATKCGHIFCKHCIVESVKASQRCPTCRAKLTLSKDMHPLYLA